MRIFAQKKFAGEMRFVPKGSQGKELRIWRGAFSEVGMEVEERARGGMSRGGASNGAERNFAY